jgi:hypothetical protein
MKTLYSMLVISSLTVGACQEAAKGRADSGEAGRGRPEADFRRLPPDPGKYRAARDAADWQNPYLTVRPNGVEVKARSALLKDGRTVPVERLEETLKSLPLTAWPYGNVVAVQEIGIRSKSDDHLIERNRVEAERVLKSLGTEVVWQSSP